MIVVQQQDQLLQMFPGLEHGLHRSALCQNLNRTTSMLPHLLDTCHITSLLPGSGLLERPCFGKMLKCNIINRLIQLLGRHVRSQVCLQLCSDVLKNRGLKFPGHADCISINVAERCLRSSHIDASSNISMDRQVSSPSSPRKELSVLGTSLFGRSIYHDFLDNNEIDVTFVFAKKESGCLTSWSPAVQNYQIIGCKQILKHVVIRMQRA